MHAPLHWNLFVTIRSVCFSSKNFQIDLEIPPQTKADSLNLWINNIKLQLIFWVNNWARVGRGMSFYLVSWLHILVIKRETVSIVGPAMLKFYCSSPDGNRIVHNFLTLKKAFLLGLFRISFSRRDFHVADFTSFVDRKDILLSSLKHLFRSRFF